MQVYCPRGHTELQQPVMPGERSGLSSRHRLWPAVGLIRPHRHPAGLRPPEPSGWQDTWLHGQHHFMAGCLCNIFSTRCSIYCIYCWCHTLCTVMCCRRRSLHAWLMTSVLQWSGNFFWRDAKFFSRYWCSPLYTPCLLTLKAYYVTRYSDHML